MMFEVVSKELIPDYLMLIMKTPIFDHLCWFYTDASVRGGLTWDDFSNIEISLPSVEEQTIILNSYNALLEREKIISNTIETLEIAIKNIYLNNTVCFEGEKKTFCIEDVCEIKTGKKDVNQSNSNGKYRFYSCSPEPFFSDEYFLSGPSVIVAGNGSYTGRTTFIDEEYDLYQRTYSLMSRKGKEMYLPIVYGAMQTDFQKLDLLALHGSAIPYIVYGDIAGLSISINADVEKPSYQISVLLNHILYMKEELNKIINVKNHLISSI